MAAHRVTLGQPRAPLNILSLCSVCRRPKGREGGVRRLGECGSRGRVRAVGSWPRLRFLSHPFFCLLISGTLRTTGLYRPEGNGPEFGGWVSRRFVGLTDMRREVLKAFPEDGVIGHRAGSTSQPSQLLHRVQIPTEPERKCHRPQSE